jgi:predicted transcriptional regulator
MKKVTKLSPGEAQLLEIFWSRGSLTLAELHQIHADLSGKPTVQTLQTRVNRMVAKELLHRNNEFPAVYRSAVSKEKTQGKFFDLLEELAGRNLAPLMLHLAKKRTLTEEEIKALEKVIDQHKEGAFSD